MLMQILRFFIRPFSSFILFLCFLLMIPALVTAKQSELLDRSGQAVVGQPAPFFAAWTTDDLVFNVAKAAKEPGINRIAVVFWASWCAPCKTGLKLLGREKARLDAAGVKVYLVNVEEKAEVVENCLKINPVSFTVILDPYGRAKEPYLLDGGDTLSLPRTVIVGRDGKIIRIIGEEGEDYLDRIIQ